MTKNVLPKKFLSIKLLILYFHIKIDLLNIMFVYVVMLFIKLADSKENENHDSNWT